MQPPPSSIEQAKSALRAATSQYLLPAEISYCTYCDNEVYERALHAPLDEISDTVIDKFVADAFHHTGGRVEFLHLLPRALEAFATNKNSLASPEIWVRCLEQSRTEPWPPELTEAFQGYLAAAFAEGLAAKTFEESRFSEYVQIGAEPARLVAAWPRTTHGARRLADMLVYCEAFPGWAPLVGENAAWTWPALFDPAWVRFLREGEALSILRIGIDDPSIPSDEKVDLECAAGMVEQFMATKPA